MRILLIEDDLYGHMSDDATPLLAEFAPERTIVIGGLSKSSEVRATTASPSRISSR